MSKANAAALSLVTNAPAVEIAPTTEVGLLVDRLGLIAAEIAPLTKEADKIKAMLRATGDEVIEGNLFRATISTPVMSPKTDYAAVMDYLVGKFKISEKEVAKAEALFTTTPDAGAARVAVKAKKGE